jgi:hypothetical protein
MKATASSWARRISAGRRLLQVEAVLAHELVRIVQVAQGQRAQVDR